MFSKWFAFLKGGLSRRLLDDRISGHIGASGFKVKLKNLYPFIFKQRKRGLLGGLLIIFATLITLPRPLIIRYLTDDVIIGRRIDFSAVAILLLVGVFLAGKIAGLLEEYYFASLERDVLLDIQQGLLEWVLRFPKSFFDQIETGYLMSRLSSDVEGLQWFFSGTIVYIIQSFMLLLGAAGLLFYLEWRLAIGVLISVPGLIITVRYFSRKIHILNWQGMEQEANVLSRFQESLSSFPLIKAFSSEDRTLRRLMSGLRDFFQISLEQTTVNSVAELAISSLAGIARAIVKDPDMLILDDPTSALDSITEMSILHILPSIVKDKTLFVVTQRFSTTKDSDRVLLLNGESLTVGTHRSLMETNEVYRSLVRACG